MLLISKIRVTRLYSPSSVIGVEEKSQLSSSHSFAFVFGTVTSPEEPGAPGVNGCSIFIVTVATCGDHNFILTILSVPKCIGAGRSVYIPCQGWPEVDFSVAL